MPQGMEPEVKKYLKKVMNSVFIGLLWLSLNVLGGLYWDYAIVSGGLSLGNIIFYVWFILSLAFLLRYYYKVWKD